MVCDTSVHPLIIFPVTIAPFHGSQENPKLVFQNCFFLFPTIRDCTHFIQAKQKLAWISSSLEYLIHYLQYSFIFCFRIGLLIYHYFGVQYIKPQVTCQFNFSLHFYFDLSLRIILHLTNWIQFRFKDHPLIRHYYFEIPSFHSLTSVNKHNYDTSCSAFLLYPFVFLYL